MAEGNDVAAPEAPKSEEAVTAKHARPNWMGKLCPYLSQATLRAGGPPQPQSRVIGATMERIPAQEAHAMSCQGPQCMLFVPMQEQAPDGQMVQMGGACAPTLIPVAVNQLSQNLAMFAEKYKIKPWGQ